MGTKDSVKPGLAPAVALACKGEIGVFQVSTLGSNPANAPEGSWRQITQPGVLKESHLSSGCYLALGEGYVTSTRSILCHNTVLGVEGILRSA